jgi:asparagine synthase (glutamine-hydrolysing)
MPGIVGLITRRSPKDAQAELGRMVQALLHESFYVSGKFVNAKLGVYAGWVSRKGAFADPMPLQNESKKLTLLFSGEDFQDPSISAQLKERGHCIQDQDADYLVHLAEEGGFPKCLNGRFHGLLVDEREGTTTLFNDRYGMDRLYVREGADSFYFAAEAKAILEVQPELRQSDPRSFAEFITCGAVLENRTLFRDIQALPPGSAWLFRDCRLEKKTEYFNPLEWEEQGPLDKDAYHEELREEFTRILPRYFSGRERVGVSLTGGLDTRMIMAWSKADPGSMPTYTFGGPYRECHDVKIARNVAQICQQPYQVINLDDGFLSQFSHYAERAVYLSDGGAGVNRAPDLYCNEIAGRIAPVRMTGNYGSEVLRRIRAFKSADPTPGLFQDIFLMHVAAAKEAYQKAIQGHAVSFTAFRQAPWYQYGLLALEQTQLSVRSPFLDNNVVRMAFRAPKSDIVTSDLFANDDACSRLIADGNMTLHRLPTDRGLGGKEGIASRVNRNILEFSFKAEYAYDYGMPQWMAKIDHAFAPLHLERLFLGRHKFSHFRVWYRDQLSKYVQEVLLDPLTLSRPYLNRKAVEGIVRGHLKGNSNYTSEIHKLMSLELFHRLFIDSQPVHISRPR